MSRVVFAHIVEYHLFKALWAAASRIPPSALLPALEALGTLLFRLGVRRDVVKANLRAALGESLPERELRRIAIGCYARLGRAIAEIVHADRLIRTGKVVFAMVGQEHLDAAVRSSRGAVLLTAHLGNFLLGGFHLRDLGYRLVYVAKKMTHDPVDEEIRKIYRMRGNEVIPIRGFRNDPAGGLRIFRALRQGKVVVILNDQDAGPEGYPARFFNLPALIPSGPALFAYRAGVPVLSAFVTRDRGKIRIEIQPPIDYSDAKSGEEAAARILEGYSRRLEETVRQFPEDYFWLHKKWKSAPVVPSMYKGGAT